MRCSSRGNRRRVRCDATRHCRLRLPVERVGEEGCVSENGVAMCAAPRASPRPASARARRQCSPRLTMALLGRGEAQRAESRPRVGRYASSALVDMTLMLSVSLEDLYFGNVLGLNVPRKIVCPSCHGKGGRRVVKCPRCTGSGTSIERNYNYCLGLSVAMQVPCRLCRGQGEVIPPADVCYRCAGNKTSTQKKIVDICLVRGMKDGQIIKFSGEGNEAYGRRPGDLSVVLHQVEHNVFQRHGDDLHLKMVVECSKRPLQKTVRTLDGRHLRITILPDEESKSVPNEGMPIYNCPLHKGQLIIKFVKNSPNNLSLAACTKATSLKRPYQN